MHLNSLHDLFIEQLKDIYDAENQIIDALPKMASATSSPALKSAFEMHLKETKNQVERLNQVFSEFNVLPGGKSCKAMQGLIEEGNELMQHPADPVVKDAALIAAAQRVEHYEIASYGTVRTYAEELGYSKAADLLQKTLDEEGATDKKLTKLAEGGLLSTGINEGAKA